MNIILLSGGSGQRLWPLSNDIRSKQFIKFLHRENGERESMVQRVYRQIKEVDADAVVTIATSKLQASLIRNQIGDEVNISIEPYRRDTFPAIALAAAFLKDKKGIAEDESIIVCPVDPYAERDYFEALKQLNSQIPARRTNLLLMGIEPTHPSERYGYIIPESKSSISKVRAFKEKPTQDIAQKYMKQGALWNCGVFAFKLGYMLQRVHEQIEYTDYEDLFAKYETLNTISFDYAVVEKEKDIEVMRFSGVWKDIGTWNTLTEVMDAHTVGEALFNKNCENIHVINELNIPILCMGLKDVVVAASPEGILVSDKQQSDFIKPFANNLNNRVMYAEKSWGTFYVLDVGKYSMTLKITIEPGQSMSYHSHAHRKEIWTIVSGEGRAVVDGIEQSVKTGDILTIEAECRHMIAADTELQLIEMQFGKDISASDKQKFPLNFT